jgi:predicted lipid-binding transport protein (Tim44 family)
MSRLLWVATLVAGLFVAFVPIEADAKRFGGARSSGMQRNTPPAQQPNTPPSQGQAQATPNAPPAAPAAAAAPVAGTAAAAAAAPKRSWLGPVAGLAAGLGLAALFSHLGLGAELANFVMLLLLVVVGVAVVRFLLRGFGGNARPARGPLAMAGAGASRGGMQRSAAPGAAAPSVQIGSALREPMPVADARGAARPALPAGFDVEGFERLAKMLFIRMQSANDAADLSDLRNFTTPELFAALRLDLQERGDAQQHTDVTRVDAQLIDFTEEDGRQVVSVRYAGALREAEAAAGSEPTPFDEVWHLVKPADDSRPWAIAGIQQTA